MSTQHPAIELSGLRKGFRSKAADGQRIQAVDGIDLTIPVGQVVAFLGPNGAGKTTTIDMILGLTKPDDGQVRVLGEPPSAAVAAGRVSAVLQNGGLLPDFTVAETVRIIAGTFGRTADVDVIMSRADITDIAGRTVSKCSGGEQQRLRFALALIPNPDVIILDEPTAGMDVKSRRAFWATMRSEATRGRTVIFATHYLEEADDFADRIVMVSHGRVVADGDTASIRAQSSGRTVSAVVDEEDLLIIERTFAHLDATRRGGRVYVTTPNSDELARFLLTSTRARDVEIASANLEDAFVALTSSGSQ